MAKSNPFPPAVVIFGDEPFRKTAELKATLDSLLPPNVDRALALTQFDGTQKPDLGGPSYLLVREDLCTMPFLADRRVVLIRDADAFISAERAKLEAYFEKPSPTGTLVLECRSFPATTRLYKAIAALGGRLIKCEKLKKEADLIAFSVAAAQSRGKRIGQAAAGRIVGLIGGEQGTLDGEIAKLCIYVADRPEITDADVTALVGQSREERIFAVLDAAAEGDLATAMTLWRQVIASDPAGEFKAVGGIAYVLRNWLTAHDMLAEGATPYAIAGKVRMWGREKLLQSLLRRTTAAQIRRLIAALADLDAQAKSGARSIETGVEMLLLQIAQPAA